MNGSSQAVGAERSYLGAWPDVSRHSSLSELADCQRGHRLCEPHGVPGPVVVPGCDGGKVAGLALDANYMLGRQYVFIRHLIVTKDGLWSSGLYS
jgi:hypothetical protein